MARRTRSGKGYTLAEMLIVLAVLGTLVSIGGGIGGSTIALFKLRAAAERLMQDIRATREAALARGPLIRGGTGIHFFAGKVELVGGALTPTSPPRGFSYVPYGFTMRRDFVERPPAATANPVGGAAYLRNVINLPDGITVTVAGAPAPGTLPPAAPVPGSAAGRVLDFTNANNVGFLDLTSEGSAAIIDLTDPSVGTARITISGPPGQKCNPVLEFF